MDRYGAYVVDVLASNDRSDGAGLVGLKAGLRVSELSTLLCQAALVLLGVVVVDFAVLNWDNVVVVGLWEDLGVLHGLDGGVVVILVDLLVNSGWKHG